MNEAAEGAACPHCGARNAPAPFCIRCGEPLTNTSSRLPHQQRGYAAAPHEHLYVPRIVSTLFPHLTRAEMVVFEATLLGGAVAIVVLSAIGLFPLALITAAALVPFLVVLYLWNVRLYEDAPLPMLTFTVAWGGAAGVGLGLVANHAVSTLDLLSQRTGTHTVLVTGVLLPLATLLLSVAGPLVLLRYRRFDTVLDGATFGGACGVTCVGAETITNSAGFLAGGLRAPGDTTLWAVRLLTLGVAIPVLAAGAVGTICAAFWLRYRVSMRDRAALGLLGTPAVALAAAAIEFAGFGLAEVYVDQWWALLIVSALAAIALVSLRRAIHLGLREEAGEPAESSVVSCPNCGRDTPAHHFCAYCGVGLAALAKSGPPGEHTRPATARIRRHLLPVALGAALSLAVAVATVTILQTRPAPVEPPCSAGLPCGLPPSQPAPVRVASVLTGAGPLEVGSSWTAAAGVGLRYDPQYWQPLQNTSTGLLLKVGLHGGGFVLTTVIVEPASVSALSLLDHALQSARSNGLLGLTLDTNPAHTLLGPTIGVVPANGAMYTATVDSPPSPSTRIELAFEVATSGGATTLVEAVTNEQPSSGPGKASAPFPAFALVDQVLDTLTWPSPV
jgi:hypothetical protein